MHLDSSRCAGVPEAFVVRPRSNDSNDPMDGNNGTRSDVVYLEFHFRISLKHDRTLNRAQGAFNHQTPKPSVANRGKSWQIASRKHTNSSSCMWPVLTDTVPVSLIQRFRVPTDVHTETGLASKRYNF